MPKIPMGFREIAADLRARIIAGEYETGGKLPPYRELAALYSRGVSTIQRAVLLLEAEGYIVGLRGDALYVAEKLPKR